MKFCAVLRSYPKDVPGGAEYQAYLICRELSKRGYETHYVAHQSNETRVTEDDGITVHRLAADTVTEKKFRTLKVIDADVYYFRLAPDLPLLWRAKRQMDAKFVYNVSRDVQCRSLLSSGPYHESNNIFQKFTSTAKYATYRSLLRIPNELFAQTNEQQFLLEKNHGLQSTVIGNGHPASEGDFEKDTPPVVLWLSNLKSVKQPEKFIRLAEKCTHLDCQFWMVGQPVNNSLHSLVARKSQKHKNLDYFGGCNISESNAFFERASVYVHTGHAEGFPNTFIQSWLHKTPVVSLCTDPDSVLKDNDVGTHCQTLSELERVVTTLVNNDAHREEIGQKCHEYGVHYHSIGTVVNKIERRIEDLTKDSN